MFTRTKNKKARPKDNPAPILVESVFKKAGSGFWEIAVGI
jgi:hypothetical protein